MNKKKPPYPTGRVSERMEPNLQNIPIKTELGRRMRDGFFEHSRRPFSQFAEQEARAFELAKGEDLVKEMLADLPPGARVVSQVHDEIEIDFSGVERELALKYIAGTIAFDKAFPTISNKDKEALMAAIYGKEHAHVTTACEGTCQRCGEQVHDSHDTRIEKLERRVSDLENNLREIAGIEKG